MADAFVSVVGPHDMDLLESESSGSKRTDSCMTQQIIDPEGVPYASLDSNVILVTLLIRCGSVCPKRVSEDEVFGDQSGSTLLF